MSKTRALFTFLLLARPLIAGVTLAPLFQNGAVLQRDEPVPDSLRATFLGSHPKQDVHAETLGFFSELEAYEPRPHGNASREPPQ